LALFLDSFIVSAPQFEDARLTIEPNARGKSVLDRDESE
jgi:predicted SpoU family rRNA methylase